MVKKYVPTGKSVLLFSGGMDSVMQAELLNPDILLRIPMNETYEEMEKKSTEKVVAIMHWEDKYKSIDGVFNFKEMEVEELMIIPNRNAYLLMKASEFGEKLYFSGVEGDTAKDKDATFFELAEKLLNHMWLGHSWTETRTFTVSAPFHTITKTELLAAFLAKQKNYGFTDWEALIPILSSYSCFIGKEKPCGVCKPCMRKAVALVNNGFNIYDENHGYDFFKGTYFQDDPLIGLEPLKEKFMTNNYRGREAADTVLAYNKMLKLSPNF